VKEAYKNLKQLLNKLEYSNYGWYICGDLKIVSLLMCLQPRYTMYYGFYVERTVEQNFALPEERLASEEIS
jgi:hypothetical protein